jgi:hypothetical protein
MKVCNGKPVQSVFSWGSNFCLWCELWDDSVLWGLINELPTVQIFRSSLIWTRSSVGPDPSHFHRPQSWCSHMKRSLWEWDLFTFQLCNNGDNADREPNPGSRRRHQAACLFSRSRKYSRHTESGRQRNDWTKAPVASAPGSESTDGRTDTLWH